MMRSLVCWVLWLYASVAWAAGIEATIDRRQATTNDQLVLQITVEGSQRAQPVLPELSDFVVRSAGQSSQMSFMNGRQSVSVAYSYVLIPKTTGRFTIGPASVELGGQRYESKPFQVEIVAAGKAVQREREVFVTGTVSSLEPFVGEPVVYTFRFYRRVDTNNASLELPEFDGFVVEDLGEQRDYKKNVDGQQFMVTEFKKSLTPLDEGEITLPPALLQVSILRRSRSNRRGVFGGFFGNVTSEDKVLRTSKVKLTVRKPPAAPAGYSGLVGKFDLTANLSRTTLEVGASTTLEVKISGTGNVRSIPEPSWGDLSKFKVYDDKPKSGVNTKGATLRGHRTFTKSLVPLEPGTLEVGPIELVVFDSKAKRFRTLRQGPFTLEVAPGEGEEDLRLTEGLGASAGKVAVRVLGDDILPIYRRIDAVDVGAPQRGAWVAGGMVLPPLLYLGLWGWTRRNERYASDASLLRRRNASKVAARYVKEAKDAVAGGDASEAVRAASRGLRGFIGDKLGKEGGALTSSEAERVLLAAAVSSEVAGRVRSTLDRLEAQQYGGGDVDLDGLVSELEGLITEVDRGLRGRG